MGVVVRRYIPYSGKVWWGESLANLAKLQVIRQIKPSKLSIQNSSVAISTRRQCESSIFAKLSFAKTSRCPIRQTFPPPNIPAIRYVDILIIIITFFPTPLVIAFLAASSLLLCSFLKCFFVLVYVIFVQYSKRCSKNIRDRSKIEIM